MLQKEEDSKLKFMEHLKSLKSAQLYSLIVDVYSGKAVFKKNETMLIYRHIIYCAVNYSIYEMYSMLETYLEEYPSIKHKLAIEKNNTLSDGVKNYHLYLYNLRAAYEDIEIFNVLNLPMYKKSTVATAIYYRGVVFSYMYIFYDNYKSMLLNNTLICFGGESKSHDASFRSIVMLENCFISVLNAHASIFIYLDKLLGECKKHITIRVYEEGSSDNYDDIMSRPDAILLFRIFCANWYVRNYNNHFDFCHGLSEKYDVDSGESIKAIIDEFSPSRCYTLWNMLRRSYNPFGNEINIWNLYELTASKTGERHMYRSLGQKIVALYGNEKSRIGDITCRQWLELYISQKVSNFSSNNVSFNFAALYDWTMLNNVDMFIASNTLYKESDSDSNSALLLIFKKISSASLSYIQEIKKSKLYLKYYESFINTCDTGVSFTSIMFGIMYGILCLNEKLGVIHGDLHTDNIMLELPFAISGRNIVAYLLDDLYVFEDVHIVPVIIDFGRSFIYETQSVDRMMIYYKTLFPEFYKAHHEKLLNNMENNRLAAYKVFSAFDIYMVCDSIIDKKLTDQLELVVKIQDIARTYLLKYMLDLKDYTFCAREVITTVFSDYVVSKKVNLDVNSVSRWAIFNSKSQYSFQDSKVPPWVMPNIIRHNKENLVLPIGDSATYLKKYSLRISKSVETYNDLKSKFVKGSSMRLL